MKVQCSCLRDGGGKDSRVKPKEANEVESKDLVSTSPATPGISALHAPWLPSLFNHCRWCDGTTMLSSPSLKSDALPKERQMRYSLNLPLHKGLKTCGLFYRGLTSSLLWAKCVPCSPGLQSTSEPPRVSPVRLTRLSGGRTARC